MARRPNRKSNDYGRYVSGNLAYDYNYLERERRRRAERERQEQAERERREYAEHRAREAALRTKPRSQAAAAPKHRERQHVSPLAVLGFAAAAAMMVALLMSYAKLTAVSDSVVKMQSTLSTLEDEHVSLLSRYERTFDLTAIKEAAEAAGMAKPSASQIYYVDLSAPDSVVLYRGAGENVLGRALAAVGQSAASLVEYFK